MNIYVYRRERVFENDFNIEQLINYVTYLFTNKQGSDAVGNYGKGREYE